MVENIISTIESEDQSDYKIKISENNADAMCRMIENMFSNQDIKVIRENLNSSEMKLLKNEQEIYQTSIDDLRDTIIMTNSDQYMTATDQLKNISFSDLILKLTGKSFYLKGYPKSHNEKLILITISRYIEKLSYEHGGQHYATFQNISRLDDEIGTYEIYKNLGQSVDDLNLYGTINNNNKNLSHIFNNIEGNFNLGQSEAHRRLWVVIHISDEHHMALAAVEHKNNPNEWNATWTNNREKVLKLEKSMNNYF